MGKCTLRCDAVVAVQEVEVVAAKTKHSISAEITRTRCYRASSTKVALLRSGLQVSQTCSSARRWNHRILGEKIGMWTYTAMVYQVLVKASPKRYSMR